LAWTVVGTLAAVAAAVAAVIPLLLNRRQRRTKRIDEEIKSLSTETENVDSLKAAVLESEAARQGGWFRPGWPAVRAVHRG
jgi:hypothetical protein